MDEMVKFTFFVCDLPTWSKGKPYSKPCGVGCALHHRMMGWNKVDINECS